jgi:solute carrier family 13 (sodium-dependent dicarboxylate transporter), member 2/3/5
VFTFEVPNSNDVRLSASPGALKLIVAIALPILVLFIPREYLLNNLTIIEHRVIALFVFAALFWILEPIPIYATSMLIILLELLMLSDSSFTFLHYTDLGYGTVLSFKEIMATLASPIIILFLGGFFLAAAATKYRLDQNIARILLNKLGTKPQWVMLGIMCMTAVFSMFMSNTATTAMMLAIILPVLKVLPKDDKGRVGFILAIPIAANLGGLGTPIGTPPNAIALKFINGGPHPLTFSKWMAFGVPFVLVMVVVAWVTLTLFFPMKTKSIELSLQGSFAKSKKAILVYITFILTILLWLFDFVHGVNSYVVALIPVGVFLSAGIINKEDLKTISWEVLWLVSGGLALGLAIEKTGFATHLIESIPFETFNAYTVIAIAIVIGFSMANFMSHTATSNLILPLLAVLGTTVKGLDGLGGSKMLVLATTFALSMGMCLPISSPPNALAHATGDLKTKDMAKSGLVIGITGVIFTVATMALLNMLNYFI